MNKAKIARRIANIVAADFEGVIALLQFRDGAIVLTKDTHFAERLGDFENANCRLSKDGSLACVLIPGAGEHGEILDLYYDYAHASEEDEDLIQFVDHRGTSENTIRKYARDIGALDD